MTALTSIRAEHALLLMLPDHQVMDYLVRHFTQPEVVVDKDVRAIVEWAVDHYGKTGRAPSKEALRERYADVLEAKDLDLDLDCDDTVEEALGLLHGNWVRAKASEGAQELISSVAKAPIDQRVEAFQDETTKLMATAMSLQPRNFHADMRETGRELLSMHERAKERGGEPRGLLFGLPEVDTYSQGVWEKELAILIAYAKMGKTRMGIGKMGHANWAADRATGIWTMEVPRETAQLLIACEALGLDSNRFARGELDEHSVTMATEWVHDVLEKSDTPLHIFSPEDDAMCTPEAITSLARSYEIDVMLLDQLTFMVSPRQFRQRNEELKDILKTLHRLLKSASAPLSCLLLHQVNREGAKEVHKTGRLQAWHASEGVSVEQYCDSLWGLQATEDQVELGRRTLTMLMHRRVPPRDFDLLWRLEYGMVRVLPDLEIPV